MIRSYQVNTTGAYLHYSPFFPNPISCTKEIVEQYSLEIPKRIFSSNDLSSWLKETWEWHYSAFYFDTSDLFNIAWIALAFTVLRMFLNKTILQWYAGIFLLMSIILMESVTLQLTHIANSQVSSCRIKHIPKWLNILEHDALKFPESAWKVIVYTFTWSWALYLCIFNEKHQYFYFLQRHWNEWMVGSLVPSEVYWLYILQMGFYVHSIYASAFLETIRKDFVLLMLHHFLTFGLLSYSYGVRYYGIGLLVLFFHDLGDIMLEFSKCLVYLKTRNGVECKITDFFSNVSFGIFLIEWVLLRLYWFLTKAIYSSAFVNTKLYPNGAFYLSFNVMLIALYSMQVYWFYLIMKVLQKIIFGDGIADNRETKEEISARELAVQKEKLKYATMQKTQ